MFITVLNITNKSQKGIRSDNIYLIVIYYMLMSTNIS